MRSFLLALVAALALAPASVSAQGLADDAAGTGAGGPPPWAYSIAHDLMSPFCPGRTLAACPSPQADQLRQWILFQASSGQSREEVEAALFDRFGDVMLSAPKAEGGWGISAYAIPIGGFLLGGPLVAFAIYRLSRGGRGAPVPARVAAAPVASPAGPSLSDEELQRMVDEELRETGS
jgi:cytochrome c-type biogenesis protein CcmH/NrfF